MKTQRLNFINKRIQMFTTIIINSRGFNIRFASSSSQNNPPKEIINSEDFIFSNNSDKDNFTSPYTSSFINHLLDQLFLSNEGNKDISYNEIQKRIEMIIINQYDVFYSNNKQNYAGAVYSEIMVPSFIKYIIGKEDLVKLYIKRLKDSYKSKKTIRKDQLFIADILSVVDNDFIVNLCLSQYLLIYTYQNSDNDKNYNLIRVSISIGSKLLNRYFNILKNNYNEKNHSQISYSDWVEKWEKESEFYDILNDTLRTELGCKIIDLLDNCDMIKKELTKPTRDRNQYILKVTEDFGLRKKERII